MDQTDEDEVTDLVNLLNELNAHHDLTVKLSNQSKIMKFLNGLPIIFLGKYKSDWLRLLQFITVALKRTQRSIDYKLCVMKLN